MERRLGQVLGNSVHEGVLEFPASERGGRRILRDLFWLFLGRWRQKKPLFQMWDLRHRSPSEDRRSHSFTQRRTNLPQRGSDLLQRITDLLQRDSDLPQRIADPPQICPLQVSVPWAGFAALPAPAVPQGFVAGMFWQLPTLQGHVSSAALGPARRIPRKIPPGAALALPHPHSCQENSQESSWSSAPAPRACLDPPDADGSVSGVEPGRTGHPWENFSFPEREEPLELLEKGEREPLEKREKSPWSCSRILGRETEARLVLAPPALQPSRVCPPHLLLRMPCSHGGGSRRETKGFSCWIPPQEAPAGPGSSGALRRSSSGGNSCCSSPPSPASRHN